MQTTGLKVREAGRLLVCFFRHVGPSIIFETREIVTYINNSGLYFLFLRINVSALAVY